MFKMEPVEPEGSQPEMSFHEKLLGIGLLGLLGMCMVWASIRTYSDRIFHPIR
jgi:hypothetical protein